MMLPSSDSAYASSSLDPLPQHLHDGMIAMGVVGLVSTISTLSLLIFITFRMICWRHYYESPIHKNQIFVLIYNLLLADFQQALSFLLAFYWISQDKLVGPSPVCFAQGWLIQIGDLSSGLWVLAIAVHTFIGLVAQKTIPYSTFVGAVLGIWVFCLALTSVGPIRQQTDFFVPAGLWCWIGEKNERDRLTLHYLWIFVSQLGSLVIYISIFFFLRIRAANAVHQPAPNNFSKPIVGTTTTIESQPTIDPFLVSRHKILRTARYMIVYPFAYVILTLPLAAGRVASMAGRQPPLIFFSVAGTMMASCGFIDVGLYIYTRKALVRSNVGLRDLSTISDDQPLSPYPGSTINTRRNTWNNGWHGRDISPLSSTRRSGESMTADHNLVIEKGAIVVSKTITRSEISAEDGDGARFARSDSLRSLVGQKDNDPQAGTDVKSWLSDDLHLAQ